MDEPKLRAARNFPVLRKTALALAAAAFCSLPATGMASGEGMTALTGQLLVNTTTTRTQAANAIGMDAAGNFVVTWSSFAQDGDGYGVFARLFNDDGTPLTGEFQVNTVTAWSQDAGGAAMDASGDFTVAWDGPDGFFNGEPYTIGAYGQRFLASGAPAGGEFVVANSATASRAGSPKGVAMDPAGDFVVTWIAYSLDGSYFGAYARVFNSAGAPRSPNIAINQYTSGSQMPIGVAMDAAGDFVVAWSSYGQDGDRYGVYARTFDVNGVPLTDEFPVNITTNGDQTAGGVAMDAAGDFVVTWTSDYPGDVRNGGYARLFHLNGAASSGEILVDAKNAGAVAMDAAGDFTVAMRGTAQGSLGYDTYVRAYTADGAPRSGKFDVTVGKPSQFERAVIAMNSLTDIAVGWSNFGSDGSESGAYVRKVSALPLVDLSLRQTGNTSPVAINSTASLTYTLTATNGSATGASGLELVETLGPGLSFNSYSSADPWTCTAAGNVVTCNETGTLGPGASSMVDITVDTGATAGTVKSTATLASTNMDPVPANNNKNVSTLLCDPAAVDSIGFGSASFPGTEGVPVSIVVNRIGNSCGDATVHYATIAGGSAPSGDFTAVSGNFTWTALEASKKTFTLPLGNDAIFTGNRTVNLQLSGATNATLSRATASVTIKDNEPPLAITLSSFSQTVDEEGGVATVVATLTSARAKDTIVPLSFAGSAIKGKDYVASAASILIHAGDTSGQITVTGLHDLLDELNETVAVAMGPVSGVPFGVTTINIITFTDDDAQPTVSFDSAATTRAESKTNSVNLVLSAVSGQDVTVNVSSTGGTATAGADYTINGSGTVTIPAGAISATAVTLVDDAAHESSETAIFQINSATHATPSGIQTTTLTITDNDP